MCCFAVHIVKPEGDKRLLLSVRDMAAYLRLFFPNKRLREIGDRKVHQFTMWNMDIRVMRLT